MKLKHLTLLAVALLFVLTGCQNQKDADSHKILVAYFSATGTTKHAAEDLAKAMDGTLFEIVPAQPYTAADLDWKNPESRSSVEMNKKASRPEIKNKVADIGQYDIVFIGYPIWWFKAPTIINTFIEQNDLKGKTIIPFATSGGSPIKPSEKKLEKQYPELEWAPGKLLNKYTPESLEEWKKEILAEDQPQEATK